MSCSNAVDVVDMRGCRTESVKVHYPRAVRLFASEVLLTLPTNCDMMKFVKGVKLLEAVLGDAKRSCARKGGRSGDLLADVVDSGDGEER